VLQNLTEPENWLRTNGANSEILVAIGSFSPFIVGNALFAVSHTAPLLRLIYITERHAASGCALITLRRKQHRKASIAKIALLINFTRTVLCPRNEPRIWTADETVRVIGQTDIVYLAAGIH